MKNNLTKHDVSIIIIFVLLLIIGNAFIYLRASDNSEILTMDKKNDEMDAYVDKLYTDAANNIRRINDADIKSWTLYTNKEQEFSFRYPSYYDKFIVPQSAYSGEDRIDLTITLSAYNDEFTGRIIIIVHDKPLDTVKWELKDKVESFEDIAIAKVIGKKGIFESQNIAYAVVLFEKNSKTYSIIAEDNEVLEKICSSFTFQNDDDLPVQTKEIETTSDSLKTYKNEEHKFMLEYPSHLEKFTTPITNKIPHGVELMVLFSSLGDESFESIVVMVYNLSVEEIINAITIDVENTTINGLPAKKGVRQRNGELQATVIFERNNRLYVLIGKENTDFKTMLNSFIML